MPVIPAIPNVGSQIERAMIAYFTDAYGKAFIEQWGLNFYSSNDFKKREAPCISIMASHSEESPTYSMDKDFYVAVEATWTGQNEIGSENPDWNRVSIDNLIGVAEAALSQTTTGQDRQATCDALNYFGRLLAVDASNGTDPVQVQEAANNEDMANFTCLRIFSMGDRRADKSASGAIILREVRTFKVSACSSNVGPYDPAPTIVVRNGVPSPTVIDSGIVTWPFVDQGDNPDYAGKVATLFVANGRIETSYE